MSDAKDQIGAVLPCPASIVTADLKSCFHQSFANNTFEKMYGGRILDDVFFMGLAQVFQAELPIKLMVHTRATRWKLKMAKRNPIAITFNNGDSMDFIMNLDGLVLQEPKKESKEWTGKVQVLSLIHISEPTRRM